MKPLEPREIPRYYLPEVASYVRVKPATLANWIRRRDDLSPIIQRPVDSDPRLSYNNLIEAYVVDVLRRKLRIPLRDIRRGIERVERSHGISRFLLSDKLRARHGALLIEAFGGYENVGRGGQLEIPEVVEQYLQRIVYEDGLPIRLYPITRRDEPKSPRRIVILPAVGFGKPVIEQNFVATAVVFDRFSAGESVDELAEDYDLSAEDIEEAIRTQGFPLAA